MNTKSTLRLISLCLMLTTALFMSLVALGNLLDPHSNWVYVHNVLAMSTTDVSVASKQWRAITNPTIQHITFYIIIAWECLTALVCWIGSFRLLKNIRADSAAFQTCKSTSLIGLAMVVFLYFFGFLCIAGEWFEMWASPSYNAQATALGYAALYLLVLLVIERAA